MTIAIAIGGGLLVGLLLGSLGAGGSVLAVPVLVLGLGLDPYAATTGALVVVGAAALAGAVGAHRRQELALDRGLLFGLVAVGGTVVGATASGMVDPSTLLVAFAILMVVIAVVMLVRPSPSETGDEKPVITIRPWRCNCPRALAVAGTATIIGLLTGFLGVGGGFLVVPALVVALGLDLRTAAGTSLVVITITSAVALATRLIDGAEVPWATILVLTATALVATLVAGRLSDLIPVRALQIAFPVVLLVVAGLTLWQGQPGPA